MNFANINNEPAGARAVSQLEKTDVGQNSTSDEASVPLLIQDWVVKATNNELSERTNEESRANTIDPTFLETLLGNLRA